MNPESKRVLNDDGDRDADGAQAETFTMDKLIQSKGEIIQGLEQRNFIKAYQEHAISCAA